MGGWGGERVVGKTLEPCKSRLPQQGDAPPPPPCPPPSPPAPPASPSRDAPAVAAGSRSVPGASRSALTAELGAPAHTGGERAAGKVWSRAREERGRAGPGPGPGPEGKGGGSGAAAQPGHCISPQPAAAAAVIFQAHRGSLFRVRLPSSLPPRPDSSRRQLPAAEPRRGGPGRLGELRERGRLRELREPPPPHPPRALPAAESGTDPKR